MTDVEHPFLKALDISEEQYIELPDYLVKGDPPDKIRLSFRNKIEPPVSLGEFTVITVTPQDFVKIVQLYINMGRFAGRIDRSFHSQE